MMKNDVVGKFSQIGGAVLLAIALFSAGMNVGLWGLRQENKELQNKIMEQSELKTQVAVLAETVNSLAQAVNKLEAKIDK